MLLIRLSRPSDGPVIVKIWQRAVDATHDFLTPADRKAIASEAAAYLLQSSLWLATDCEDRPLGFMGLTGEHVDCLFIDPDHHGKGIGRGLIAHALSLQRVIETEVNAQNHGARAFYARLGFVPFAWTPDDGEGRAYPLVYLRLGPARRPMAAADA